MRLFSTCPDLALSIIDNHAPRNVLFLHGIMGNRRNWGNFVKLYVLENRVNSRLHNSNVHSFVSFLTFSTLQWIYQVMEILLHVTAPCRWS